MLLNEAEKILNQNGYCIEEDFKKDAEKFKAKKARYDKMYDIEDKYVGDTYLSERLGPKLDLFVSFNRKEVVLRDGTWGETYCTWNYDDSEELLEILPIVEKRAVKILVKNLKVNDDDVDLYEYIDGIKEVISTLKEKFIKLIKNQKRAVRLDKITSKLKKAKKDAYEKAWTSWDKEAKAKIGTEVEVKMRSGKTYTGTITGEKTDKKTGNEFWIITKDSDGKRVSFNKDRNKRDEEIYFNLSHTFVKDMDIWHAGDKYKRI